MGSEARAREVVMRSERATAATAATDATDAPESHGLASGSDGMCSTTSPDDSRDDRQSL